MSSKYSEEELLEEIATLKKQLLLANNSIKNTRYGLVWLDAPEAFEENSENQLPAIEEIKERSINLEHQNAHILIEGDNYHSLTCLNYTHREKVDLIYIDPPYNTGSDGFRYKDKRVLEAFPDGTPVPKDHPLRHSYWLSFMHKRLELAHKLLRDDAVMFISINEEEYAQLKLLCDKIFQESNYLTTFTVKVRHPERILKADKDYHETVEQLLLYRKSPKFKTIKRLQDNTSIDKYIYHIEELIEDPEVVMMGNKEVKIFKPGEYKVHKGEADSSKFQKINIRGSLKEGNSSGRFHMKFLEERNDKLGYLYKVPDMGDDEYPYRYFQSREKETLLNGSYFQGVPTSRNDIKEVPYSNYLDFEEVFNAVGSEGGIIFRNGKKPVDFLKYVFSLGTLKKDAVILDFFAGSGSTGHAVMEMNSIDGGNRQAILCTNNENNIAREVTQPRLLNVIKGYQQVKNQKEVLFSLELNPKNVINNLPIIQAREEFFTNKFKERYNDIIEEVRKDSYSIYGVTNKQQQIKGLNAALRYYQTVFVGQNNVLGATDEDKAQLAHRAGYLLAIAENTLNEVKSGDSFQFFSNGDRLTAIYFKEELDLMDDFIAHLTEFKQEITVYIFSWANSSEYEDIFDHIANATIKVIPQPILEIYRNIYNLIPTNE